MGLFDEIEFEDPDQRLVCAVGHKLGILQTKDLGESFLYKYVIQKDGWVRTHKYCVLQNSVTAMAYTDCDECESTTSPTFNPNWFNTTRPWCEYSLEFRDGYLYRVTPVRLETVEQMKERVRELTEQLANDQREFEEE